MQDYDYVVRVTAQSRNHAEQVMAERINHDEDYGFPYTIGYASQEDW